tara:strand:+ start:23 stop:400 length:378 start_codon:yes stop_codon:yes gene_type:complete
MTATVYSGSGDWSYTNSTGGNVRVIIGCAFADFNGSQTTSNGIKIRFGVAGSPYVLSEASGTNDRFVGFGRHVKNSQHAYGVVASSGGTFVDEFWLADGHTANITAVDAGYPISLYNVMVIPEGN